MKSYSQFLNESVNPENQEIFDIITNHEYKTALDSIKKLNNVDIISTDLPYKGESLLYASVCIGRYDLCKAILEKGGDVNILNTNGEYSLESAIINFKNITNLLFEYHIDPNIVYKNTTVLNNMIYGYYLNNIKTLLEHGADPNIKCLFNYHAFPEFSGQYFNSLFTASLPVGDINERLKMVKLLIQYNAEFYNECYLVSNSTKRKGLLIKDYYESFEFQEELLLKDKSKVVEIHGFINDKIKEDPRFIHLVGAVDQGFL